MSLIDSRTGFSMLYINSRLSGRFASNFKSDLLCGSFVSRLPQTF